MRWTNFCTIAAYQIKRLATSFLDQKIFFNENGGMKNLYQIKKRSAQFKKGGVSVFNGGKGCIWKRILHELASPHINNVSNRFYI